MNKILGLFNEVFQDCQVYGNFSELLKDRYPEVKKWRRYAMGEHVTFYTESRTVKRQVELPVKRENIHEKQQMALWNL